MVSRFAIFLALSLCFAAIYASNVKRGRNDNDEEDCDEEECSTAVPLKAIAPPTCYDMAVDIPDNLAYEDIAVVKEDTDTVINVVLTPDTCAFEVTAEHIKVTAPCQGSLRYCIQKN